MENRELIADYIKRAQDRVLALELFLSHQSWANAVRESQEVVELVLKALLRAYNFEVPRVHEVSRMLSENEDRLPPLIRKDLSRLIKISKDLRRDRELAFYGSEDLTPSQFYSESDAQTAVKDAKFVVLAVVKALAEGGLAIK